MQNEDNVLRTENMSLCGAVKQLIFGCVRTQMWVRYILVEYIGKAPAVFSQMLANLTVEDVHTDRAMF